MSSSVKSHEVPASVVEGLGASLEALRGASSLLRQSHLPRLLSQVDVLTASPEGLRLLLGRIGELEAAGVFRDGPWEDPSRLVPALVPGTLKAGGQTALLEILSELRILAIADGELEVAGFPTPRAREFLHEALVNSLDLMFPGDTDPGRGVSPELRAKIGFLMELLRQRVPLEALKHTLANEIELICLQRPIVTARALRLISVVRDEVALAPDQEPDRRLGRFVDAVFAPSPGADGRTPDEYGAFLRQASSEAMRDECRLLSGTMADTGLAVAAHAVLVRTVASDPELLADALGPDPGGRAELERHHPFVQRLVGEAVHPETARSVHGLARLLERGLLSHQPVLGGLERIRTLDLDPEVGEALRRSRPDSDLEARRFLLADCVSVLGQPLGVGQGRNPTCQSARGISLWSRHAPGKLLEMIRTVASTNDLAMRFEGRMIRSSEVGQGLLAEGEVDPELDAASLVLVPHLDRIYNEMMRRASLRQEDPHRWVNPAMYGHWIPTGFVSAHDQSTGRIRDYDRFLRTFYATHHPDFNRGHDPAYPNPVGIFLTSSSGALVGFHAVSILRVRRAGDQVRVHLFNPNTEGRQRWHSDIAPTVTGHGEEPGESSLPFDQFASRIYAFHFNPSDVGDLGAVDDGAIARVEAAARESWGRSYHWEA